MKEDNNYKTQPTKTSPPTDTITPLSTEGQIVIEEKQSKPNGEVHIV